MKSGQAELSGAKQGQTGTNGAKQGQTGPNRVKRGQKGPKKILTGQNVAKRANGAKRAHIGLIFCMHAYFYEIKKSHLATQALRQKLAELWGFC